MPPTSARRKEILIILGLAVGAITLVVAFGRAVAMWAATDRDLSLVVTGECYLFRTEIDPTSGNVTQEPVQITPHSIVRRDPPSASPDGQTIAYGVWVTLASGGRAAELRSMNIDGSAEKILLAAPASGQVGWRPSSSPYAWSPNGKFLLYDQYPGGFSVLELASGETLPVPGGRDLPPYERGVATWSPDGTFLVLNRDRIQ